MHDRATINAKAAQRAGCGGPRILFENVYPAVESGRFPVKRIAGEDVDVWVDILCDGHALLGAELFWRAQSANVWSRIAMRLDGNDRWTATFRPSEPGRYLYAIEAWIDLLASWRHDFIAKRDNGQDTRLEIEEGKRLLASIKPRNQEQVRFVRGDAPGDDAAKLLSDAATRIAGSSLRAHSAQSASYPLVADRVRAREGAWYEMVPRSQSPIAGRHGTFEDCIRRVPEISALGFDVLYLTPIHPIGRINRKGRNNSVKAASGDPGSPYAIGSAEGGHDAVHPQLGTIADFRRLVDVCARHGMEVALDFAVQCAPDHPWVAQHPEWFPRRPDGSIKYAENPPKKYEDIVNPDLCGSEREALWAALRDVLLFWRQQGVRIFRVDNPHTKPFPFWEWLIREVQSVDPGVIFLSEAFTRPKVMKALAKLGFTQSYTYFTWRTGKDELQSYLSEITGYPEREYFRPNLFVNTPDILPFHLQSGEPWIFKARFALAATLSGSYGIYNGFELLEHRPLPGKEEYLDSEKYEINTRDWNKPGNIKDYIARLNAIRHDNPALLQTSNLRFAQIDDAAVIGYIKESGDGSNAVAVAIALAPEGPREPWFHFGNLEIGPARSRRPVGTLENLVSGERHRLEWGGVRLRIDPQQDPALLFRCLA